MKNFFAKLLLLVFPFCMLLTLIGCSKNSDSNTDPERLRIVTTIFPLYDFARVLSGDAADVTMLLKPGNDSHLYDPSPADMMTIKNADIFIYIGGESDEWIKRVLSSISTVGDATPKILTLMDCVEPLEEALIEGMQAEKDAASGSAKPEYDEHIWTSPKNAELICEKITDALCEKKPGTSKTFRKNLADYKLLLSALDSEFRNTVETAKRRVIVFGDRYPFRYLADRYGLTCYAAFPGCSSETEPSPTTVAFLINKIRTEQLPVVFHIEFSNQKMAKTISESTGATVLLLHSCHNISPEELTAGASYLSLMKQNLEALNISLNE